MSALAAKSGCSLHRLISSPDAVLRGKAILSTRRRGLTRIKVRSSAADAQAPVSTSAKRLVVKLKKPVGVVFAQKPEGGPVFVEEVVAGGAAAQAGVLAGDVLLRCSSVIFKSGTEGAYEREGYGQRLYDNWEVVMFDCRGQDFSTVMAALKSNNERWGIRQVTLEFNRD